MLLFKTFCRNHISQDSTATTNNNTCSGNYSGSRGDKCHAHKCYEPQEPLQSVSPLTYEASFSQPTTITGIKLPAISASTTTTVVFRIKRAQGDEWITVLAENADSGSGDLSGSGLGESENQGEVTFSLSDSASTNIWLPSALGPVRAIEATFGAPLNLGNEIEVYGCQGPTPAPTTRGTSPPGNTSCF
ncbi:uncharacterized protein [Diadema setosum]|uniref:uncharacterized protein n=1 Tax=Diadema setosum TaxID=31175 RepID=UPI003B3A7452